MLPAGQQRAEMDKKEWFEKELAERTLYCEEVLEKYLPAEQGAAKTVIEAMNYSVRAGGKRLRPMFIAQVCMMYGGRRELAEPFMAALEMIHTYSLVHDDLPCMDNDEYRRGRKTTHAVYGEGMAVLAGDGLLNYAYETALRAFTQAKNEQETQAVVSAMEILAGNAGIFGMVGGQCADIEAEEQPQRVSAALLDYIHEHKTACMIESGFMIGAVLAGAPGKDVELLRGIASDIGVAFQIRDDILDVTGDEAVLGKPIGSDAAEGKRTYVDIHGMEKAQKDVEELSNRALERLASLSASDEFMTALIQSLIDREK